MQLQACVHVRPCPHPTTTKYWPSCEPHIYFRIQIKTKSYAKPPNCNRESIFPVHTALWCSPRKSWFRCRDIAKKHIKMTEWKPSNLVSEWTASEKVWVLSGGEILLRTSDFRASTQRNSLSTGFGVYKSPAHLSNTDKKHSRPPGVWLHLGTCFQRAEHEKGWGVGV